MAKRDVREWRESERERFRQRHGARREQPRHLGPAALRLLGLELAPLQTLADWPPLAERLGGVLADVAAEQATEVARLQAWARRWQQVPEPLQRFYADPEVCCSEAGTWALYRLLNGEGTAAGPRRGALDRLWEERHGTRPAHTLIPKIP